MSHLGRLTESRITPRANLFGVGTGLDLQTGGGLDFIGNRLG